MKTIKARIRPLLCFVLALVAIPMGATEPIGGETWKMLDDAEIAFENGEFGDALLLCEKARDMHSTHITQNLQVLKNSLTPSEVKSAGDDIDAVYPILEKRNDNAAIEILDSVLLLHPRAYFGNSVANLVSWLEKRIVYPETDFLAGKIYEAEGENAVALSFYEKAWQNRAFFDIPDERFTLIYRMADLSRNSGNKGAQEKYLLLVLTEDPIYGKPGEESATLLAMLHTLETEQTVDKFFRLYRHSNLTALKAYQDLALFYYADSKGRLDRALPIAVLSACISVTALSDAVSRNDFEYAYASLADVMVRAGKNAEISSWARAKNLWYSLSLLADILYEYGEKTQAVSLWTTLSGYCPDENIASHASTMLRARSKNDYNG